MFGTSISPGQVFAGTMVLGTLCAAAAAQPNLVFNGGFETGNFAGWGVPPNVPMQARFTVTGGGGHSGIYYADMASTTTQYIDQFIPTQSGTDYELSFWVRQPVNSPSSFRVRWEGGVVFGGFMALPTPNEWYHFTVPLHANISGSFLEFGQNIFPLEWQIDDISVVQVPGPGSAAVFAVAGVAAMGRRRRRN